MQVRCHKALICIEFNVWETLMKKVIALVLVALAVTGCTQTEKGAAIGAASGAIIGGAITNDIGGAAVGGLIGGAAGAVIGNVSDRPGECYYRDRHGRRYIASCPSRYHDRHHYRY
jgi:hypothetical protein